MKKLFSVLLAAIVLALSVCNIFAADDNTEFDQCIEENVLIAENDDTFAAEENELNAPTPRMLVWNLSSFSLTEHTPENQHFEIDSDQLDNRYSTTSTTFTKTLSTSGSLSATLTESVGVSGELSTVVSKVKEEVDYTASVTASWSAGEATSATNVVPAGMIARVTVYLKGVHAGGTATYTVLDTSRDVTWTEQKGLGAIVPVRGFNFVFEHLSG